MGMKERVNEAFSAAIRFKLANVQRYAVAASCPEADSGSKPRPNIYPVAPDALRDPQNTGGNAKFRGRWTRLCPSCGGTSTWSTYGWARSTTFPMVFSSLNAGMHATLISLDDKAVSFASPSTSRLKCFCAPHGRCATAAS